jgi:hypothetical protein
MARLGQFSLLSSAERATVLSSAERATVLAARTRAVRDQLAHFEAMRDLAVAHGERRGALVTGDISATRAGGAARPRARLAR